MSVRPEDIDELRRIYTNTYNADKSFIKRVMQGIAALNKRIATLEAENKSLKSKSGN